MRLRCCWESPSGDEAEAEEAGGRGVRAAAAAGRGDGGRKAAMGLSRRRSRRRDGRLSIVAIGFGAGCWLEASMTERVRGVGRSPCPGSFKAKKRKSRGCCSTALPVD